MAQDLYYDSVSLLLHGNGTDGSTTFTDNSPSPKTITPFGNAQIDTAQSKFGGASMLFDGTGDYLSTPYTSDWSPGSGDYTVECWIRPTSLSGNSTIVAPLSGTRGWRFYFDSSNGRVVLLKYDSSGNVSFPLTSTTLLTVNTWQHVAWTKVGATYRLFINGIKDAETTDSVEISTDNSPPLIVGRTGNIDGGYFVGNIDDLRITKGVARYTANFTPTTEQFADTGPAILPITSLSFTQTNNSVNLLYGRKSIIDTTAYTLTLNDVILTKSTLGIVIDTTAYTTNANNVTLLYGRNQVIDVTSFTQTNNDIGLSHGYQVIVDTTVFNSITNTVGLLADRKITVDTTSYVLTANDILLIHGYNLVVDNSPFTLTNNDINLLFGRKVVIDATTYILINSDIVFSRVYSIPIDAIAYTLTNNDLTLSTGRKLALDSIAYLLTDNDMTLSFGRNLLLDNTNYTLTNNDINLLFGRKVILDTTQYALTDNDLFFLYSRVFNISNVNYSLTNNNTNLLFGRKVGLNATQYALMDNDLVLLKGSKIAIDPTSYSIDSSLNLLYDRIFQVDQQEYLLTFSPLDSLYSYPISNNTRLLIMKASP